MNVNEKNLHFSEAPVHEVTKKSSKWIFFWKLRLGQTGVSELEVVQTAAITSEGFVTH